MPTVVLPLFLILVAIGTTMVSDRRVVAVITAIVCIAGLTTAWNARDDQRSQAVQVAADLNLQAQPGDLVVYCPDQLGPAVDRLLKVHGVNELTYPRAIGPQRVDWVDYKSVIDRTDVGSFAQEMLTRLGAGHTLWLVYNNSYPGLGGACGNLQSWFNMLRPQGENVISANPGHYYESDNLVRYSG